MKRKLNESVAGTVKIDVVSLVHDYPELQGNIDKLAKQIEDTTGASVSQDESDDTIYMVIDGTTQDDIIDIFSEDYYIDDIDSYFAYDDNFSFDAIKDDNFSLDAIKDDNPDFEVDDAAAAQGYAEEDMMDEDMGFDDEGEWLEEWDDEEYDDSLDAMIPDYDDVEIDVVEDGDDDIYSDEYESTDDEYSDEPCFMINGSDIEIDGTDSYYSQYHYLVAGYGIFVDKELNVGYGYYTTEAPPTGHGAGYTTFHDFTDAREEDVLRDELISRIDASNIWK